MPRRKAGQKSDLSMPLMHIPSTLAYWNHELPRRKRTGCTTKNSKNCLFINANRQTYSNGASWETSGEVRPPATQHLEDYVYFSNLCLWWERRLFYLDRSNISNKLLGGYTQSAERKAVIEYIKGALNQPGQYGHETAYVNNLWFHNGIIIC